MAGPTLRAPIPAEEPRLRIGIIMPEDRRQSVAVDLQDPGWQVADAGPPREASGPLVFAREGATVALCLGGTEVGRAEQWTLAAPEFEGISRATVCGVLAGRGFHWRKLLDVALTDILTVRVHDGQLVLVNEVPLERYLAGVITSEMSGDCPASFLEAQAVVARSWTLSADRRKHAELAIDFCNDDCCQRFQGLADVSQTARGAVARTRGVVLRHGGGIVEASYSKSCGGIVESPEYVWGRTRPGQSALIDAPADGPTAAFFGKLDSRFEEFAAGTWLEGADAFCGPLRIQPSEASRFLGRVDDGDSHFRWSVDYAREELECILRAKLFAKAIEDGEDLAELDTLLDLVPLERGLSGRITALAVDYRSLGRTRHRRLILDQHAIREALSETFLLSSAFFPRIERDHDGIPIRIVLIGAGWGHGAGFCQQGGVGMALAGYASPAILAHYFPGVAQERIYR